MIDVKKYKEIRNEIYKEYGHFKKFAPHTSGVIQLLTDFIRIFGQQPELPGIAADPVLEAPKKWITVKDFIETTGRLSSSTFCKLFKSEKAKKFSMKYGETWFFDPWEALLHCREHMKGSVKRNAEYILNNEFERKRIEELIEKKSQPVL